MAAETDEFGSGWQQWNLQAWFDYTMIKLMMSRISDVIPKTYVPILRLVAEDAGKVDDGYRQVVSLRTPTRFFDSPRERWRKIYGSYIRELDWVYRELQRHFPTEEYQELVIDIMARAIRDAMSTFLPSLEKATRSKASASAGPHAPGQRPGAVSRGGGKAFDKAMSGRLGRWLMNHLNPASFMVGPVEMKMLEGGELEMYIPRCWMHAAPSDGRTQDEACVQGCKGACERVFNRETPVFMLFEPHLPEYSCTLRVKMGGGAPQAA
jgi:hypothetical protein